MNDNKICKKCGKTLDIYDEEICFRCCLQESQENFQFSAEEQNFTQTSKANFYNNSSFQKKYRIDFKYILMCILGIISIFIIVGATFFDMMDVFLNIVSLINRIGRGNYFIGTIVFVLAFWGAIQIFRGFCAMCDNGKISSTFNVILTIAGYIALLYAVSY